VELVAAAVDTNDAAPDVAAVRDLGPKAPVFVAGSNGVLRTVLMS
jgi:hypothetical protein